MHSTLGDTYNLYQTLGSGGFAKVKLGHHLPTNEYRAVKIIKQKPNQAVNYDHL